MGDKAKELENERLLNQGPNKRLFKTDAGPAYQGEVVKHDGQMLILKNPRKIVGLPSGWPDLTGFESVVITPDMVGQKVAIFVGEEIKAGKDRMSTEQKKFQKLILSFGGIFRIVRG
jgi:hypothetical protein